MAAFPSPYDPNRTKQSQISPQTRTQHLPYLPSAGYTRARSYANAISRSCMLLDAGGAWERLLGAVLAAELRCLRPTFVPGFLHGRWALGVETKLCQPFSSQSKTTQTQSSIGIRERRAYLWIHAAFASQLPWLRIFSRSGRNPRPSSLRVYFFSCVISVVVLLRLRFRFRL